MVGRKKLALILTAILAVGAVACGSAKGEGDSSKIINIGITQFTQHPALDDAREGFIEGLKEKGYEDGKNIKLETKNSNGEIPTSQQIAQQFVNDKKDLIFGIGTPSVQVAYNQTKEIPIVFTAITDPVASGLAKSFDSSGNNLTGMSDGVEVEDQLNLLLKLVPDVKTIGFIYNTSEDNSTIQLKKMEETAKKFNINIKKIGVTNVNDVAQNLELAIGGVDALYTPTDNTVASAFDIIGKVAVKHSIPILGAEEAVIERGGLTSLSINYKTLGKEAAYKAVQILEGKKPSEIAIERQKDLTTVINEDVAKKFGITIPEELKGSKVINGGV